MIEHEQTYLLARLPEGLERCDREQMTDVYFPVSSANPKLRLRKSGDRHGLTKKSVIGEDASQQEERTIPLTEEEFETLTQAPGKTVKKTRYYYPYKGKTMEIDVFRGDLQGLALAELEFDEEASKASFARPDFCLADVTHEDFIAGGRLAGKAYEDLEEELARFGYEKIRLTRR